MSMRPPREGTGIWQSTRESGQQVPTFSIMQAPTWPDTKDVLEGKTKQKNLATKRQRKLLTGSHGNRGATDKALPRKAVRLRRKAPPFNLTLLSFVASPSDKWVVMFGDEMSVGWIIKSWACRSRWNINSHGNVSVIEKVNEKSKDKNKIARGWGHLGVCWDWQKEKHWQHTLLRAGGHVNMSRLMEKMQREMKRVRKTKKPEDGEERDTCGSAIMCSFYPPDGRKGQEWIRDAPVCIC